MNDLKCIFVTYIIHLSRRPHVFPNVIDEDKVGPTILASMLGFAILVNFAVNLYDISK